jgi:Ankyrin repeats (3 copies)
MTDAVEALLSAFDGHEVEGVRAALEAGADPCSPVRGKPPVFWLLGEYTRSDRLGDCLRLLLERGAVLPGRLLRLVLLNDAAGITEVVRADPAALEHRATLVSAFTPLAGVSLLHVAAEYGNLDAARALVEAGADVNARADTDEDGLNGHTPLFHTVNSIHNRSEPIMRLLLDAGARTDVRVAGLTWGRGYEWETTVFDVTPISYAQMGLLPQMHRRECDIYANVRCLLEASGRGVSSLRNVPNRYLRPASNPEPIGAPDTGRRIG